MTLLGPSKLSRIVPAHQKTVVYDWCKRDFMEMSPKWRAARTRLRGKEDMNACTWCLHKFIDGEMMALAHPLNSCNKLLCQTCVDQLIPVELSPTPPTARESK